MVPELGHFALILALLLAIALATLPTLGAARGSAALMALARPLAAGHCLFVSLAFACLAWSFARLDLSVANVANNASASLPLPYRLAAAWGSHEGSMLLWLLLLSAWTFAASRRLVAALSAEHAARALGVLGAVSAGFALFLLFTSNPFARVFPPPLEGRDLNPLLQDPAMVLHPPLLYTGYVGFGVVFALAIAGLLAGRLDAAWAAATRRWALLAWGFLTLGITVGSAWAYYELGWGGWWFWDPVENASLMPWLVGTALLHSLAATARRGVLGAWSALLAILVFSLSLMGTFLVRSGVLTSVHAFATDPERGVFMLAFLALVVGGSFALFAARAPGATTPIGFAPGSRESLLLANNVLLLVAAGTVLLGTLYPLALETLKLARISVGPPYFEATFVPLSVPLLLLAGVGPLARWGPVARGTRAWTRPVAVVAAGALIGGLALPLAADGWRALTGLGLTLALWVLGATTLAVWRRLRSRHGARTRPPRRFWGMVLAHAGIAVFVAGATLVRSYETWDDRRLAPGEATTIAGYSLRFEGTEVVSGPNYQAERGRFDVRRGGRSVTVLFPEKRRYALSPTPMTEAAIHASPLGDLYLSLGEPVGRDGAWLVRIASKPFVVWIWVGWVLMAAGALLAWSDRDARRRAPA